MSPGSQTTERLETLLKRYRVSGRPITVNFRELVSWLPYNTERASHFLHPYPAKLILHIPHFFLNNDLLSSPNDYVLDPFCGSGTVLVEGLLAHRNALGIDSNPLASLIAKAKTTCIEPTKLRRTSQTLVANFKNSGKAAPLPNVVNLEHWFYPHVIEQLQVIKTAIETIRDTDTKRFFLLCFSACVRKVSLADPRISVPVRLHKDTYPLEHKLNTVCVQRLNRLKRINVYSQFNKIVEDNILRVDALRNQTNGNTSQVYNGDAKSLTQNIPDVHRKAQIIITSPPYLAAQKYVRASSLSLGWLGMCQKTNLKELELASIGREHYPKDSYSDLLPTGINAANNLLKQIHGINPLRAHIGASYLNEMETALTEACSALKKGGYFVLVAGNNRICNKHFPTKKYLASILLELGLKLRLELADTIQSRGLMTRRNTTASVIARESVLVFQL